MRPIRRYRYTFSHPLYPSIEITSDGETPCMARGLAWQLLETQLRETPGAPVDNHWRVGPDPVLLGVVG